MNFWEAWHSITPNTTQVDGRLVGPFLNNEARETRQFDVITFADDDDYTLDVKAITVWENGGVWVQHDDYSPHMIVIPDISDLKEAFSRLNISIGFNTLIHLPFTHHQQRKVTNANQPYSV